MTTINRLGGLHKSFDHLQLVDGTEGKKKFERAMMLYKPTIKGRSFWVPDSCGWKYIDPVDNADMHDTDVIAFADLMKDVAQTARLAPLGNYRPEMEAFEMAAKLAHRSGFLRMTTYSLVKCCQLLDITVDDLAIYQLLNFIQDGLRELQIMALPLPQEETEIGEAKCNLLRGDEVKTWHEPLTVKSGELSTGVLQ
jgi:hypothetical protein